MGTSNSFHKHEKLCHKATIDAIFKKKGESVFKPPILLAYYKTELITPFKCQVMISVGKRKFKKAIDRHRVKRQISESYRLHKQRIYEAIVDDSQYAIGLLYLSDKHVTSAIIDKSVHLAIDELIRKIK
ncbi:MAG TPA: ribonuclease P protein component [Bacteroidetes bacterium]|jgi:ribonuclease P protein component|nr:ribonuclease P protein component [Bacteroidota bacterium]|tara:strand:+ start:2951 stop:3337 length:387 start_codon:yes stop_codon:yes gene_type:complete